MDLLAETPTLVGGFDGEKENDVIYQGSISRHFGRKKCRINFQPPRILEKFPPSPPKKRI
jgi:hypothetical protein